MVKMIFNIFRDNWFRKPQNRNDEFTAERLKEEMPIKIEKKVSEVTLNVLNRIKRGIKNESDSGYTYVEVNEYRNNTIRCIINNNSQDVREPIIEKIHDYFIGRGFKIEIKLDCTNVDELKISWD